MMFKGLPVAIFVSLLSEACSSNPPEECDKANSSQPFSVLKFADHTWYILRMMNVSNMFDMNCTIDSYATRMDNDSLLDSMVYLKKSDGTFGAEYYEIIQFTPNSYLTYDLKDKSLLIYGHPVNNDEDILLHSLCFVKNGNFFKQAYIIWSKERIVDRNIIDNMVKSLGGKVNETYVVDQDDNCFKYTPKL